MYFHYQYLIYDYLINLTYKYGRRSFIKAIRILAILFIVQNYILSEKVWLKKVKTADKVNGVMIQLEMENIINEINISAWQSKSDWFYITLFKTHTDTNNLFLEKESENIRAFQPIMNQESVQLGFHMRNNIEYFDIEQDISNNMAFINLHYPTSSLTDIVNLDKNILNKTSQNSRNSIYKWLYLSGSALIVNGLINQKSYNNWQTQSGIAIISISILSKKIFKN